MQAAAFLWPVSSALALAATIMMLALVVRRVGLDRRTARAARRREELSALVIAALDPEAEGAPLSLTKEADRRLLGQIGRDLLDLLRGEDRGRLLDLLEANGIVDLALTDLTGRSDRRRAIAAALLAPFTREDCRSALMATLQHDRAQMVRQAAAFAVVEWGDIPPIPLLVAALDIGRGGASRRLMSLFRKIAARDAAGLMELADSDPAPAVMILVLDALSQAGHMDALPLVLEATRHPKMDVRAEAYRSLAQLGHPAAAEAVAAGLEDSAWPVRAQAALCVGRIGLVALSDRLAALLDDLEWWVRYRAAEALTELGPPGMTVLESAAPRPDAAGRIAQLVLAEKRGTP
jgi:HEAT repeat protein